MYRSPPSSPPFPYTTLFRSRAPPTGRSRSGASTSTTRLHTPIPPRLTRPPRLHRPPLNRERRAGPGRAARKCARSEEHTSELQSHSDLVCRLLLEKKNHKKLDNRIKLLEEILSFRMQGVEFDNGDMYVDGHKAASDVRDEVVYVTEKIMKELSQC